MVPLEDYEDDYVEDRESRGADERGGRRARDYEAGYEPAARARFGEDRYAEPAYPEPAYKSPYQPGYTVPRRESYGEEGYRGAGYGDPGYSDPGYADRYDIPRRPTRIDSASPGRSRGLGAPMVRGTTHGALAVDPEVERRMEERRLEERARFEPAPRRAPVFEDGGPLSKITTLRPRTYAEAAIIGERFRDGTPVIMDLVEMSNSDARRLVDFAAGLAFALRGSFDKVATKVFLLSPADVDVSAEERRRIAETGFYNQK
jgi:cell division inhibitor SepF